MEQEIISSTAIQLDKQIEVFSDIITHTYLHSLADCEIRTPIDLYGTPVRWYKISKIVLDKDVFFIDALSMLYTSLHSCAKNVILVIEKQSEQNIDIYLGARDFSGINNTSGEILLSGLQGYLPGVKVKSVTHEPKLNFENTFISEVSALASLFDNKKDVFVQGIERLINATSFVPRFSAYFIADNINDAEANSLIYAFNELRNSMAPLAANQVTVSESHSEGVTESLTHNISSTITKTLSQTLTQSKNYVESKTTTTGNNKGESEIRNRNIIITSWNSIWGGRMGTNKNEVKTKQEAEQKSNGTGTASSNQTGESYSQQRGEQKQSGTNISETSGISTQFTYKNGHVQHYLEVIESHIKRINSGIPFGLWSVATYFIAPTKTTAMKLANLYKGCIVGEHSNLETCAINVWEKGKDTKLIGEWLGKYNHPRFNYKGMDVSAGIIVTSKELAVHFSLPQSSVPGLLVKEEKTFGRTVTSNQALSDDNSINIGNIIHLGQEFKEEVRISIDSLSKHTLVTGTTGSGKSNTLFFLISELQKKGKSFLIIEPAKGEYKDIFGSLKGVSVYGTNPMLTNALCINPFIFPEGITVDEHIESLVEIFNACWPMYAAMPQALKHSIIQAYKNCGWDISKSQNPYGLYPMVEDVIIALRDYINTSEYSAETKADYKGSLETRLQSLCEGVLGRLLNGSPIPDNELFNKNVIIDLSRIKSNEAKSLIMGLIIMKLDEFRSSENKGMNLPLRHVTILEEAHNLLKRTSTLQSSESANLAGMAVERIANSMAEMRTYGEGFIIVDQSPSMLDFAAIRNTNTKIIMQLPDNDDRNYAGRAIGLQEQQILEISKLKTGEAVVYQSGWEEAVKAKINYYNYEKQLKKWSYSPSTEITYRHEDDFFKLLYCGFIDSHITFSLQQLKESILKSNFSGKMKVTLLSKINGKYTITADLCAHLFVELVGVFLFKKIMEQKDFKTMNLMLKRSINSILPPSQLKNAEVFENMYILGCSNLHHQHFYDKWIYLKTINK